MLIRFVGKIIKTDAPVVVVSAFLSGILGSCYTRENDTSVAF